MSREERFRSRNNIRCCLHKLDSDGLGDHNQEDRRGRGPVATSKRPSRVKRFFKWLGIGTLLVVLSGGAFAAHEWYAAKPLYLNNFLNRELLKVVLDQPEMLTRLGFLESVGITGHNAELNDDSPAATDALFA